MSLRLYFVSHWGWDSQWVQLAECRSSTPLRAGDVGRRPPQLSDLIPGCSPAAIEIFLTSFCFVALLIRIACHITANLV
jgi:hypothetical protein